MKDIIHVKEAENGKSNYGISAAQQVLTQLVDMIEEGHFLTFFYWFFYVVLI
jgi:hypothetical protein